MSDAASTRSTSSTLSRGAGFDEHGPFLVIVSGLTAERRVLRPGSILVNGITSKPRIIKEGDFIMGGFFDKPVQMPKSCQSPYVTPTTSPDASPYLEASGHGRDELPPKMRIWSRNEMQE